LQIRCTRRQNSETSRTTYALGSTIEIIEVCYRKKAAARRNRRNSGAFERCACRKSNSHIQMMKSAEKWLRQNATNGMCCSRRPRPCRLRGACEPRYSSSRKIAADGEDAARRKRRRGQDIPTGSNRSPFHTIRSAMAIAVRLADPECSSPEGGG